MSPRLRLVSLTLEAFRGFADARELNLDADVVLVRGDNGTGKTSISDGLLWLFTGTVPRLRERARGLRKGEDPLINRYRPDLPALVRLVVATPDGRRLTFERQGKSDQSAFRAWDGDAEVTDGPYVLAQVFGNLTPPQLSQAVSSWGILQQHALLAALDSGATLHQRLAEVVGLERVTQFASSATEVAKAAKRDVRRLEAIYNTLRDRRTAASAQLDAARARDDRDFDVGARLSALIADCAADLPAGIAITATPVSLEQLTALGRKTGALVAQAQQVAEAVAERDQATAAVGVAVETVEAQLTDLVRRADDTVRRAPAQIQLASAALELLGGSCPVCGQSIDGESVRRHMTELLRTAESDAAAAADAQRAVAEAQARLQAARSADARRKNAQRRLDEAVEQFSTIAVDDGSLAISSLWRSASHAAQLSDALAGFQVRLRSAYAELRRDPKHDVLRIEVELEALDSELEKVEGELREQRARASRAGALDVAAHKASERIVERALARLTPSFSEVFDRLAPHPTFTELRATQDIFYGKNQVVPEVVDPQRGVTSNPALTFSEGQLNVVALSYFLGLALNAGQGALPFLVLDDPLQTMDIIGVLGFADLCRRLRERRQLVITTHDRRFATLLGRKLAPRTQDTRTIVHEFESWTADGPQIRSSEEPLAAIVPLLERRAS